MGFLLSLPAWAGIGCSGRIELVDGIGGKGNAETSAAGAASLAGSSSDIGGGGTPGVASSGNAGAPVAGSSVGNWGAAGSVVHLGGALGTAMPTTGGSLSSVTGAAGGVSPWDNTTGAAGSVPIVSGGGNGITTAFPGLGGAVAVNTVATNGGTDANSSPTTTSGGTTIYVTSVVSIGGNTSSIVTFPGKGGTSATTKAVGGATSSTSASPCAGVVCPTLPDLCTSIVQAPGACCPTCAASSCPLCPEVTSCAAGMHPETKPGACCPECVPDACVAARDNYLETVQSMAKKYSTGGCKTSPDCVVVPEKNACAISCGNVVVANMADSFANGVESMAKSCADCAPPTPPETCPIIVPACVNGRCIAASPG